MSQRIGAFVCLAAAALPLGGCDAFNRAIGKEKVVPDEFAVVSRAPLAVPPDFSLRPPRIGEQRPQEQPPSDQAREAVFRVGDDNKGNLPPAASQRSPGEGELLKEAGAADAPSDIRQLVENEANNSGEMSGSLIDKLAFWRQDQKLGPTDNVINPVAETERLKGFAQGGANAKEIDASTALAAAPSIERTNDTGGGWFSWLSNIF